MTRNELLIAAEAAEKWPPGFADAVFLAKTAVGWESVYFNSTHKRNLC